jgi:hypothetical protein
VGDWERALAIIGRTENVGGMEGQEALSGMTSPFPCQMHGRVAAHARLTKSAGVFGRAHELELVSVAA